MNAPAQVDDLHIALTLPRADFALSVDVRLPLSGVTALFGASGSGKTSVLRAVAGLERQAAGVVRIGAHTWLDTARHVNLPTHQRPLGFVFQEASLFEHLDVQGNLRYGLVRSRADGRASAHTLEAAIDLLGIGHLLARDARSLSGGERQRVAIARALATRPRLLLLDEPLAALDMQRRSDILPWLEKLRRELDIPMLYVTHALDEVTRLADTLWVLKEGHTQALGAVTQVLGAVVQPTLWGDEAGALFEAKVTTLDAKWGLAQVAFSGGHLWLRDSGLQHDQAVRVRVLARDVSITRTRAQDTSIQNHLPCTVQAVLPDAHPAQCLVQLRCADASTTPAVLLARITSRAAHDLQLEIGQSVWAQVKSVALIR